MSITELAYVGLNSSDPKGWTEALRDVVGMQKVPGSSKGQDYYRLDNRSYRIFVSKAKDDSIDVIGWGVSSLAALDNLAEKITTYGITVKTADSKLLKKRGARAIRHFKDPEGYQVELVYSPPSSEVPFKPSRAISGFNTGEFGLGHVVLHGAKYKENVDFYTNVLGFRVSDYIVWADADATFMRCNRRHHSLALLNESLGQTSGSLNHIHVEVKSLADLGSAYDIVLDRKYPIIMSLGQHSNDLTTSFYFAAPGGVGIEVGWNGATVDDEDNWQVTTYDTTMIWGHRMD